MVGAIRNHVPIPSTDLRVEYVISRTKDLLGLRRHLMSAENIWWLIWWKMDYDDTS